jgi:predicted membrane protein
MTQSILHILLDVDLGQQQELRDNLSEIRRFPMRRFSNFIIGAVCGALVGSVTAILTPIVGLAIPGIASAIPGSVFFTG